MSLRVLIPYDVDTTGMRNPYLFLLLRALRRNPEVEGLHHGYGWLMEDVEVDIIHLHWPEILISSQLTGYFSETAVTQNHIDRLMEVLENRKAGGSKIILTVHNEAPHIDPSGKCGQLYRDLYSITDGFIHMGHRSRELLAESYPEESAGKDSFVIPHGNYHYFPDDTPRNSCREILGIERDRNLLLSFGAIRSKKELNLGIEAFNKASVPRSLYLMAGKLPYPHKLQKEHFPVRRKLYLNQLNRYNNPIRTDERIIPAGHVQHYLNAADLLFIPRFNTLNSGNVALGFTFGKVVAGPAYGVIGEILESTGNPVFDPYDLSSVSRAIRKGFELARDGHGEKNRKLAQGEMDWRTVADKTVTAYKKIR